MRINLSCPFEDRYSASALGARWDIARKTWYVIDPPDLQPFARWLPADVRAFLLKPKAAKPKARRRRPPRAKASIKNTKNGRAQIQPGAQAGGPPW